MASLRRRQWHPTPVFLPGKFHGWRSLAGYSPWGHKELDITQYTLAIDRQNEKLDLFYEAHHPAILRMIEMTVKAGHAHGTWVGICGELGADQRLTQRFLEMGMDELSVAPSSVLPIRKLIREME